MRLGLGGAARELRLPDPQRETVVALGRVEIVLRERDVAQAQRRVPADDPARDEVLRHLERGDAVLPSLRDSPLLQGQVSEVDHPGGHGDAHRLVLAPVDERALVVLLRAEQVAPLLGHAAEVVQGERHVDAVRGEPLVEREGAPEVVLRRRQVAARGGHQPEVVQAVGDGGALRRCRLADVERLPEQAGQRSADRRA